MLERTARADDDAVGVDRAERHEEAAHAALERAGDAHPIHAACFVVRRGGGDDGDDGVRVRVMALFDTERVEATRARRPERNALAVEVELEEHVVFRHDVADALAPAHLRRELSETGKTDLRGLHGSDQAFVVIDFELSDIALLGLRSR